MQPEPVLRDLWHLAQADPSTLGNVSFTATDRSLPSSFHVGPVAAATIAAQALAAAQLWQLRSGAAQAIEVNQRRALAMFRSERYVTVNGQPPKDPFSPLFGYYATRDGRWIQLHTNFPHHHQGVLRVLGCADRREAVAAAIAQCNAAELEQRLADAGLCAAWVRTVEEWQAHPQAQAIAALPLFEIERIGDAPPEPLAHRAGRTPTAQRPLAGVRVLDLSRVIAAPVAARTLAQHGADVLAVGAAHLPNIASLMIDTGRGKRSAQLDLRDASGQAALRELMRGADVFLQAYRPGALAARGFDAQTLCALRPGLIQVSLSAYGHAGPWAQRRGFDSLVQSATGIAFDEGRAAGSVTGLATPGRLPCQVNDHATGYLAAFATMIALHRRAREGGSWRVRVSLAQTGHWLRSLGRVAQGMSAPDLGAAEVAPWRHEVDTPFGRVSAIAPVEQMALTPAFFELPPVPPGTHAPEWLTG